MSAIANRIAAAAAAAFVGLVTIASSQAGEADVKYRQNVMKANSAHAGSIGSWVKGEISDEAGVKHQAMALYANAQSVESAFASNSPGGRALPAIWDSPADFKAAAAAFVAATAKVADAAKANDMAGMKTAFGDVGKACGGCHGKFQAKQYGLRRCANTSEAPDYSRVCAKGSTGIPRPVELSFCSSLIEF